MKRVADAVGTVYGVGVGPGDPKLLTVRATEVLSTVAVVAAPSAGEDETSLALDIARPYLSATCRVIVPKLPMIHDQATLREAWEKTARKLAGEALAGRDVAFITLGDSTFYSTWSYVASALRGMFPEVPVETVPGVTAMSACAAYAGVPLAQGREPLLVWPAPPNDSLRDRLETVPNIVFIKAAPHLERIARLVDSSNSEAVAVRRIGRPGEGSTRDLRSWLEQQDYFITVLVKSRGLVTSAEMGQKGGEE